MRLTCNLSTETEQTSTNEQVMSVTQQFIHVLESQRQRYNLAVKNDTYTTLDDLKSSHAMCHSFMKLLLSHNNNRFKHLLNFQQ